MIAFFAEYESCVLQSESVSVNGSDLGIGLYRVQSLSQEIDVIVKVAALDGIIAPDSRHQKIAGQYAIVNSAS